MPPDSKSPSAAQLFFTAKARACHRRRVEQLFFFNRDQHHSAESIHKTIESTGYPQLVETGDHVWISVPRGDFQCLFALVGDDVQAPPVGVVLYGRPEPSVIWIVHMAVDPGHTFSGSGGSAALGCLLVEKVREIARSIVGVTRLRLPYLDNCYITLRPRS